MFTDRALRRRSKYHLVGVTYSGRVKKNFSSHLPDVNPELIVDVGCSRGITTKEISDLYPTARVVGIDVRRWPLAIAKLRNMKKIREGKVELRVADGYRLNEHFEPSSIDMVFFMNTYFNVFPYGIENRGSIMKKIDDLLCPFISDEETRDIMRRIDQVVKPEGYLFGSWTYVFAPRTHPDEFIERQIVYRKNEEGIWQRLYPTDTLQEYDEDRWRYSRIEDVVKTAHEITSTYQSVKEIGK